LTGSISSLVLAEGRDVCGWGAGESDAGGVGEGVGEFCATPGNDAASKRLSRKI
jgi:hypothetical protein